MPGSKDDEKSAPTTRSAMPSVGGEGIDEMAAIEPVQTNNVRPACFKNTAQEVLFVLTATMAIGMTSFLAGSVTVISSFVVRELVNANELQNVYTNSSNSLMMTTAQITWISSASSLSSGAFLLFFGRVADMFGRKSMFVGSLFLFSVFCLAAGFSKDAITIDVSMKCSVCSVHLLFCLQSAFLELSMRSQAVGRMLPSLASLQAIHSASYLAPSSVASLRVSSAGVHRSGCWRSSSWSLRSSLL